jgi:hypothetical protein
VADVVTALRPPIPNLRLVPMPDGNDTSRGSILKATGPGPKPHDLHDTSSLFRHRQRCNACALATAGYGTALRVIRDAVEADKHIAVIAAKAANFLLLATSTAERISTASPAPAVSIDKALRRLQPLAVPRFEHTQRRTGVAREKFCCGSSFFSKLPQELRRL